MAFTRALSTNNYGPAKLIVATSAANGTHSTLASAMADAVSGDTIFLRDSVTENVTITPGVNITGWSDGTLNTPSITGTLTMTGAGTSTISNLTLITNSANIIAVTGSAASILNVNNCYLNCTNNTGISYTSSSASSRLNVNHCLGDIGTTGIGLFAISSAGNTHFTFTNISNSGGSSTQNTFASSGMLNLTSTYFFFPITYSSSNVNSGFKTGSLETVSTNTISLTTSGTGNIYITDYYFSAGSASCISIGAGTTVRIDRSNCYTTATNAITGAGSIEYSGITFVGASNATTVINTTTQTISGTLQGSKNTAPTAGMLGQQITNSASAVSVTSGITKTITSISLTAGIWDIYAIAIGISSGASVSTIQVGISTVDNTIAGTEGIDYFQNSMSVGEGRMTGVVPCTRATLSSTTTYYLIGACVFGAGTATMNGRITATRVG